MSLPVWRLALVISISVEGIDIISMHFFHGEANYIVTTYLRKRSIEQTETFNHI